MGQREVFVGSTRPANDFTAIFEFSGDPAFFYLCEGIGSDANVIDKVRVTDSLPTFITEEDVKIIWTHEDLRVGLFLHGILRAYFDLETGKATGQVISKSTDASIDGISEEFFKQR